jgi:hypothetical protein
MRPAADPMQLMRKSSTPSTAGVARRSTRRYETAWPLDDAGVRPARAIALPVWATLRRNGDPFDVYLQNDRGGIYALGFPAVTPFGHLVNLAELTTIGALAFVLTAIGAALFRFAPGRVVPAETLLREVRGSFYRKLFLAFVAAVVTPVALLALVARSFVATEMRTGVEREALRTSRGCQPRGRGSVAPQRRAAGIGLDDNLMVWVSRLVDEDANIFAGASLQATSERTIFASGLLPSRTPAEVYPRLLLQREAAVVARERIGDFEYVVAAAPIRLGSLDAVMTCRSPRASETSTRRSTHSTGACCSPRCLHPGGRRPRVHDGRAHRGSGEPADARHAAHRGWRLRLRVARRPPTSSRRLVADFNRMASELQRQRQQLERTHRIEAWAEMARQVAHDIKNPLDAHPAQRRAPAPRARRPRRAARSGASGLRGHILEPGAAAAADLVGVLQLRVVTVGEAGGGGQRRARRRTRRAVQPRAGAQVTVDVLVDEGLPPVFIDKALVLRSLDQHRRERPPRDAPVGC